MTCTHELIPKMWLQFTSDKRHIIFTGVFFDHVTSRAKINWRQVWADTFRGNTLSQVYNMRVHICHPICLFSPVGSIDSRVNITERVQHCRRCNLSGGVFKPRACMLPWLDVEVAMSKFRNCFHVCLCTSTDITEKCIPACHGLLYAD